jgi:hypothetical protein
MRVLFIFVLAYCCRLNGQDSTIVVKAGTSLNESVSLTDLYQYPQFITGKVFFRAGDSAAGKLNYNKLLDQMQFVGPQGDTLNIANPGTIKLIRVNNDIFYYDDGYMKLVKEINGIKLAAKHTLKVSGKNKMGAYNMESPTSAIDSYGSLFDQRGKFNLVPREDVTLTKRTQYYFGDKFNQFTWALRKNLLRQFSKESGALNAYLKDNNIDLHKKEDLEKLLEFLAGL